MSGSEISVSKMAVSVSVTSTLPSGRVTLMSRSVEVQKGKGVKGRCLCESTISGNTEKMYMCW